MPLQGANPTPSFGGFGFREENAGVERWLPVNFPEEPDKAIVYPDPFDCARFGIDFEHSTVEIIDGVEAE